jgi:putative peptidoglycan lipid II flippase
MSVGVSEKPIKLVRATSVAALATLASAAFGIVRESLTAARFGANLETDVYFFSFGLVVSLPDFLQPATAAGMVPVYLRSKREGHSTVFVNTVINAYGLLLLGLTALGLVGLPWIVSILASGFDAPAQQMVTRMILILSPTIVLAGVWGILRSLLNAEGEFFRSTISTAFLSVSIIGAILLFSSHLGVYSLPVGILVASAVQVLWTGYWSWRQGFRYRLVLDWHESGFQRYVALLGPGIVGSVLSYMIPVIDRAMASHFPGGTIAALGFAGRPRNILSSLVIYSLVTALLPSFSQKAADLDRDSFRQSVVKTLGLLMFIATPLSLLMVTLRIPLIQLLFERGRFDAAATLATAGYFAADTIGLMPMAIAITVSAIFNALEDTRTPAIFGAGGNLLSKIVLNLLFIAAFGPVGLPLATSAMYVVSSVVLLWLLRRRLHGIEGRCLLRTFVSVLLATVVAMGPVYLLTAQLKNMPPLIVLGACTLTGSLLFVLVSAMLRIPELHMAQEYFLGVVNRKLRTGSLRSTAPSGDDLWKLTEKNPGHGGL